MAADASSAASPSLDNDPDYYPYTYEFDDTSLAPLSVLQRASGEGGIGTTVWDSALVLSKYLERLCRDGNASESLDGKKVIELGCGTGLVGLVAKRLWPGAEVALTDKFVDLAKANATRAGENVKVAELPWGKDHLDALRAGGLEPPYDVVLLSDVVHWPDLFEPLMETLVAVSTPAGAGTAGRRTAVFLAYERRDLEVEARFFHLLGQEFPFSHVKEEDQHEDFKGGEDLWLFRARRR
ncbi:putative methyltransferase-domain-containing protein [Hyaloraphidium curvatum]|nr:putative methyltransferase-domain-containing protein [Hyaloraphidium curvatum]